MSVQLAPSPVFQGLGFGGLPLPGGKLFTYVAGTSTPQVTYTDSTQTTPNSNPVILNANGQANVWLVVGDTYKLVLQDFFGNQIWSVDQIPGGISATQIISVLTQQVLGQILFPQTPAEQAANITPVNYFDFGVPWLWVRREGCVLDGITDDSASFTKCLGVASTTNTALLIDGPMRLNSAFVIPQNVQLVFVGNGKIRPSGVTVTLGQVPQAGLWQIFDLSLGGLIAIPSTGNRFQEIWAEWWGANGDAVTNIANDVPINAAIACLKAAGTCGVVRLGIGTFFTSAVINIPTLVTLRGMGFFTLIKPQSSWTGGTKVISAANGTSPMFDSRLESVRVDGGAIGAITQMVYSTGWQQRCGVFNCTLQNFQGVGFYYEHGYGGAAFMELSHVDIFPNDVASAIGAFFTNDASTGFMKLMLNQVSVVNAGANTQNVTGIQIDNQIIGVIDAFDIETIRQGITLTKGAVLTGAGMSGGTGVTAMINCAASWTGQINVGGVKIGNATAVISDVNRSYAIAAIESLTNQLVWPPVVVLVAQADILVSGGVASYSWQQGFSSGTGPNRTGAGSTTLTLATSMDGTSSYSVVATSQDPSAPVINVTKASATAFAVVTKSAIGAPTDASEFIVQVYHKP